MRSKIDEKSAAQGYEESRLPHFTEEEEAMVLGSSDFLGLNIYTSFLVYPEQVHGGCRVSRLVLQKEAY